MNKDYQHLFARQNSNLYADQQNFQELHAENTNLRQQIIQLRNNIILQRQQWSEEHFKLTEKIEQLQNHVQQLLKQNVERQSFIHNLEANNRQNSKEVEKVRLLYIDVLQQLIKIEGKKESIANKMKVNSVEEMKYCWNYETKRMQDSQNHLKLEDKEKIQNSQLEILQSNASIQFNLHQLQSQFNEEISINDDLQQGDSQTPKLSLLHQLKQLKTSQTIPKRMQNYESKSSNTSFYFEYSNNTFENNSLNFVSTNHLSDSESQKDTKLEPKLHTLCEQTQQQSCNWQQMLSFFLGGMWSGACMVWMIAN